MIEKEEPAELVGADKNVYKAKKLTKISLRRMIPWLRSRALRQYLEFARDDPTIGPAEIANVQAAISMKNISNDELLLAWKGVEGMFHVLHEQLLFYNPKMTEEKVEELFGDMLPETMNELCVASQFDPEFAATTEDTPPGVDPTLKSAPIGTEPVP